MGGLAGLDGQAYNKTITARKRMKRRALWSALIAVVAVFVFGGVALAANGTFESGNNVTIGASQTVDHSLFAAGNTVTINGTINGDVYCAGKSIFISGVVNGDVFCAGQELRVSGKVTGSVRAAGQNVSVAGTTGHAISLAGQSVSVEPDAKVGGDATLAGSSILIAGDLARDAYAAGASVTISGAVGRDVTVHSKSLDVTPEAKIAGAVDHTVPQEKSQRSQVHMTFASGLKFLLLLNLMAFITAMALVAIAPQRFDGLADAVIEQPGRMFLIGLGAAFAFPIAMVVLGITILGIPLAIMTALVWALLATLSGPVFAYVVGRKVMPNSHKPLRIMALGSLVVLILYVIPVVNFFVGVAAYLLGLGSLTSASKAALGKPKYRV